MNVPQPNAQTLPLYKPRETRKAQGPPTQAIVTNAMTKPPVMPMENEKGWLAQQGEDLWNLVAGIPTMLWHTAKTYKDLDYGAVLDGLVSNPKVVAEAINTSLGDLMNGATAHYRGADDKATFGSVVSAPIRRPLLVGLDALTLLSLGTTAGVRGATTVARVKGAPFLAEMAASKGNPLAFKTAFDGYQKATRGALETAAKFKAVGDAPMNIVRSGLNKIRSTGPVAQALGVFGWDKVGLDFNRVATTTEMQITGRYGDELRKLIASDFGKDLYDDFIDIAVGHKSFNPSQYPPEFVQRAKDWAEIVSKIESDGLRMRVKAASGDYTEGLLEGARLNKLQERMRAKGMPEAESLDAVKKHYENTLRESDLLGTGDIQRKMLWSAVEDNSLGWLDEFHKFFEPSHGQSLKKAGILERFIGGMKYKNNPNVWQAHYLRNQLAFQGKIAGIRAGLRQFGKPGRRSAPPPDMVEVPDIYLKNMDYHAEAHRLMENKIGQALAKSGGEWTPEAIAEAMLKSGEEYGDIAARMSKDILDGANNDMTVFVPKSVARNIDLMMEPLGGFGRLYDKGMNFWRDLVLTFMPRFYVNNLLGNSALMTLQGYGVGELPGRQFEHLVGREARNASIWIDEGGLSERIGMSFAMANVRNTLANIQYHVEVKPRILTTIRALGGNLRNLQRAGKLVDYVGLEGGKMPGLDRLIELSLRARNTAVAIEGAILGGAGANVGRKALAAERELLGGRSIVTELRPEIAAAEPGSVVLRGKADLGPLYGEPNLPGEHLAQTVPGRPSGGAAKVTEPPAYTTGPAGELIEVPPARQRQQPSPGSEEALYPATDLPSEHLSLSQPGTGPVLRGPEYGDMHPGPNLPGEHLPPTMPGRGPVLSRTPKEEPAFTMGPSGEPVEVGRAQAQRRPTAGDYVGPPDPVYGSAEIGRLPSDIRRALDEQYGYERFLQEIEPLRAPAEQAYREMEHWLGAYGKLSPMERKYIRRVIPFWTFGKTMANVMFWMPLIRPKTTWLYSSMAQMAMDAWDDERLPEYLRGTLWLGTSPKSGITYFTRLTGMNPFEMLQTREIGRVPLPALLDPTNAPLIGAMVKLSGGYDQFSHKPPPLQADQMIDNVGRVWSIDANGRPTRQSPQTPWTDVLGEMIPQISLFNDAMAFSGFQLPGRGPKLYQMPDGTLFNPRHWAWGLANAALRSGGVGVQTADLDKSRAQQRVQTIRMIRHLGKQAVRAEDPDDRAQFMKLARHAIESLNGR